MKRSSRGAGSGMLTDSLQTLHLSLILVLDDTNNLFRTIYIAAAKILMCAFQNCKLLKNALRWKEMTLQHRDRIYQLTVQG